VRRTFTDIHSLARAGVLLITLACVGCGSAGPQEFTPAHRSAAMAALDAKGLQAPNLIERQGAGFIVATYELDAGAVRQLPSLRTFGEHALLTIRESLLPFGYTDFRVNVNGTPPGTGLVRRYGSSRYIDGGSVEWIVP
jgi:hypothetical protein